jgi:hypothetical protein
MGRKLRIVYLIVCFIVQTGFLAAEISKPGSQTSKPYLGVDIAVVSVGTTGNSSNSEWSPWSPKFTLKNLGTKPIKRDLQMIVKSNGGPVALGPLWVDLGAGQTLDWNGGHVLSNFAKVGDVVEVTIDADHKMAEDNEANNVMSKKIPLPFHPSATPVEKK